MEKEKEKKAVLGGVGIGMISAGILALILLMVLKQFGNKVVALPIILGIVLIIASKAKKDETKKE